MKSKKKTESKIDRSLFQPILSNPKRPSLGRVLERRRRNLRDYLIEELGITSKEAALALLRKLASGAEPLQYSYDEDFFDALEEITDVQPVQVPTQETKISSTDLPQNETPIVEATKPLTNKD